MDHQQNVHGKILRIEFMAVPTLSIFKEKMFSFSATFCTWKPSTGALPLLRGRIFPAQPGSRQTTIQTLLLLQEEGLTI